MDTQNTNKIARRILSSAMSQKRQFPPLEGQFNATLKVKKSKHQHEEKKSMNVQKVINLPQINLLTLHVKQELSNEARNLESRNLQSRQMDKRRSKLNFHKTIFSVLQDPIVKPKRVFKPKDNTSQNSKSSKSKSKSKSKNSKSFKKIDTNKSLLKDPFGITPKQCQTPNYQNKNQLNLCKQVSQGSNQFTNNDLHHQLSAKEIMLNGQTFFIENLQTPKMFRYQSLCPPLGNENLQSSNKKLARVESGLQMIRENKLRIVNQSIQQGETEKAYEMLNFLLQIDQNDVEVMYTLAELSKRQNKHELSDKYLRLIILSQSNSPKFDQQVFKAKALHKLEKYSQAIKKIENIQSQFQVIFSTNQKIQLLKLKGEIFFDNQSLEDALECFEDTLQIMSFQGYQKGKADICLYVGTIYQQYQLNKKAKKYFDLHARLSENEGKKVDQSVSKRLKIFKEKRTKQSKQNHQVNPPPILRRSYQPVSNAPKQQELIQTQLCLDSYKICVTNHKGQKQIPRLTQKREKQIPLEDKLKRMGIYEKVLQVLAAESSSQLSKIEKNAKLHFKMGDYDKCYDEFENYIKFSTFLRESNASSVIFQKSIMKSSINEEHHEEISQGLNYYLLKIKQLQMNQMTEENLSEITKRRNHNISQAIKLFDAYSMQESSQQADKMRELSVIGEESTITVIKNSSVFGQSLELSNDIFSLKQFRQVFKIWNDQHFSIESLDEIATITYDLVKNDKTDFSILPLHVIAYTMKMMKQNLSFAEVNKNIEQKFIELCKKYPPSQKSITQSELKQFNINFSNRQKIDLFEGLSQPENFKTIYRRVQQLSRMAQSQKQTMDQICKEICYDNKGFHYKSNLKLPVNIDGQSSDKNERIYSRIIQKILSQELKDKRQTFFQGIQFEKQMRVKDLFIEMSQKWQETIDQILKEKIQRKQQTHCYVYDLMRAKAMFRSINEIDLATEAFILGDKNGQYKIIEIDNRLNNKTKDVVLKIQFKRIIGELQLALEFESQKNEFNHSLYELSRSPFGSFFASFMWLTGFATANESSKLIVNQKMKWKLRRLQHLKKFIYEDRLIIGFDDQSIEEINRRQFNCEFLYLTDFVVKANSIEGYITTSNGQYVSINLNQQQEQNNDLSRILVKSIEDSEFLMDLQQQQTPQIIFNLKLNSCKPAQKFRFFFSQQRESFASQQQCKSMVVHLNGTNYFLSLQKTYDSSLEKKLVLKQETKRIHSDIQLKNQQSSPLNKDSNSNKMFRINFIGANSLRTDDANENLLEKQSYQEEIAQIIAIQKSLHELLSNNFSF